MATVENYFFFEKVKQNGHYIKVQQSKEEPFKNDAIQTLQKNMIESNTFPNVLSVQFEELNNSFSLYYKVDGLKSVRNFIKEHHFTMEAYYSFFIQLVNTLEQSSNYMLDENAFVIEEDYIFINPQSQKINLLYLPVNNQEVNDSEAQLKQLLLHLASEVQGLDGKKFKIILNYIKDSAFSLKGVKQLLVSLQEEIQEAEETPLPVAEDKKEIKSSKISFTPLNSKNRLYTSLFGVILLAIYWKLLGESSIGRIVASVLSVLTIATILVIVIKGTPKLEKSEIKHDKHQKSKLKQKNKSEKVNDLATPTHETSLKFDGDTRPSDDFEVKPLEKENISQEADEFRINQDNLEFNYDQTVLLDYDEEPQSESKDMPKNYLFKDDDEQFEYFMTNETITIGRSDNKVEVSTKSVGVSRFHAEFVRLSDTYGLKDLGSKNGTFLNEEKIIPYKIYELNSEDRIMIGKDIFTYKVES